MQKKLLYGKESRDKIQSGLNKLCDMVKITLGPNGRTVILKRSYIDQQVGGIRHLPPEITKDGVSVARAITLDDSIENIGCDFGKDAAGRTMEMVGDQTTTTCVLLQALVNEGLKLIDAGANPHELKKGIDVAVEYVVAELKKMAIPVVNDDKDLFLQRVKQVASISANNNEVIGDLISKAYGIIGANGSIDLRESKSYDTKIEMQDGYKINEGWMSQYFVTDRAKMECVLENPYILLYDKKIADHDAKDFEKARSVVMQTGRPLLVICDDMDGVPFATMAANAYQKQYPFCVVKAPGFQNSKVQHMEDLALITGGYYVSDEKGRGLKSLKLEDFGTAEKVVISIDETVIIGGNSDKNGIEELKNSLKMDMVKADPAIKEQIEKRISALDGGVAVLYVGASSDTEMKEKKARCDDAIRATKAAISEGFVVGGGASFIRISSQNKLIDDAIKEPMRQICKNSGVEYSAILPTINLSDTTNGYNAKSGVVENLIEAGVIDPVKGLRCALQNAASVAGTFLVTEGLVADSM